MGVRRENMIFCDSQGVVTTYRVSLRLPAGGVPAAPVPVEFRLTDLDDGTVAGRSAVFFPGDR